MSGGGDAAGTGKAETTGDAEETETAETTGEGDGRELRPGRRAASRVQRTREWVLLDGNRLVLAGGVLAAVFVVLVGAERAGWIPMERDQPAFYVLSSLIGGNLTLITVVVSINQLLLSREFNTPGSLETQIENVVEYRKEVEEHAGDVAPVEPLGFLELLFENTRQEAQRIGGMTFGTVGEETRGEVDDVVESLTDHVDEVLDVLDESEADTFEVLSVTLTTNYARQINHVRRIRASSSDLPESVMEALDNLIQHLQKVDIARQYFKSLYLQEELSTLSRILLYAGFPAELFAVVVLLSFTASRDTVLTRHARLVLPTTVTVGFLPLSLLLTYILRIATVTERTAATIPFTTPEQEQ